MDPSGHVIEIQLDDKEPTISGQASGLDWSGAESYDSFNDIPDGTYGETIVGGRRAFVDKPFGWSGEGGVRGGGGSTSDRSSMDRGNYQPSSSSGLVGASVRQGYGGGGASPVSISGGGYNRQEIVSGALAAGRMANMGVAATGLAVLPFVPPVGAVILGTSMGVDVALNIVDVANETMSFGSFMLGATTSLASMRAGKIAAKLFVGNVGYHFGIGRYFNQETGRFVNRAVGKVGIIIQESVGAMVEFFGNLQVAKEEK